MLDIHIASYERAAKRLEREHFDALLSIGTPGGPASRGVENRGNATMFTRLEVSTNYRCNAVCQDCNRAIGLATFRDGDLTEEQSERAIKRMDEQGLRLKRVTLGGTEPILNREIAGILKQFAKIKTLREARLLTNDIPGKRTEEHPEGLAEARRRSLEPLPHPFHWVRSPISDPENPLSGKTKHIPFFWSPHEFGLDSQFGNCNVRHSCGKGLDAFGWSMCGVAGVLGRLLRIDPYDRTGATDKETPGICKHCPYGLSRATNKAVGRIIEGKPLEDEHLAALPEHLREKKELPRISETFRKGFEQHRSDPMEFERL